MPDTFDDLAAPDDERPARRRPRRRRWPWVLGIIGGVIVVIAGLGIAGVALAGQALEVRDDLEAAKSELSSVPALVEEGDTEQFDAAAASILAHTSSADETVQGPLWEFATWIPGVGPNVAAVRDATVAAHILVRDALPASFEILGAVDQTKIRFSGGGFNLEPFKEIVEVLPGIDQAFASARQQVADIDRSSLLPIVDDAVGEVIEVIDETAPLVHTATGVLPTALQILGDDGERTYFVMFQNNAEIRATGGNPAASMLIHVENGRVTMGEQSSSTTFNEWALYNQQFVDLPTETMALYDDEWPRFVQNYTKTPNFPTSARMFQGILAETGEKIDGVFSLDPIALSHMLEVTGAVKVDGIKLTADNVVDELLSETYLRYPGSQEPADAFFAAASAAVFNKLVVGKWDPLRMIDALQKSADEQRVYAWFTREDEEAAAAELGISGALETDNDTTTEVGIFINDSGVGKMEYYLDASVAVTCDADERSVTTAVTMTNHVDRDDLTFHILSRRTPTYGGAKTSMLLDIVYVAPPGATIDEVDPVGGDAPVLARTGVEEGREAESVSILLDRGETQTVAYTSVLPDGDLGPLSVRWTPTVTDTPVTIGAACTELLGEPAG
ncbi:DUF4012 domain-containing protein [Microbacterium thalassium]|uniref:DUF4012 domain-containing protein n=1 Tax=Microbacterium thalassium TaxID=362649 RepID=A0A7X0KUB9_9MICO|nr:DUF4012 domain-containing protein [Microbacterium thalassium]MBB6391006.1 hypothetical protein [Microbacterium thalassium]GLK24823.1 hypothetical protein GCM10017607_21410 [Microbacterium thalassium]